MLTDKSPTLRGPTYQGVLGLVYIENNVLLLITEPSTDDDKYGCYENCDFNDNDEKLPKIYKYYDF